MAWPNNEFLQLINDRGIVADINDSVGKGWFPLVTKMFDEMIAAGWDKHVVQIKEKFGMLRVYIAQPNIPEVWAIIYRYEEMSRHICEHCGESGEQVGLRGERMRVACPAHALLGPKGWGE